MSTLRTLRHRCRIRVMTLHLLLQLNKQVSKSRSHNTFDQNKSGGLNCKKTEKLLIFFTFLPLVNVIFFVGSFISTAIQPFEYVCYFGSMKQDKRASKNRSALWTNNCPARQATYSNLLVK